MEDMFLEETFNFNKTIILDIANNHYGDVSHAFEIINEFSKLNYPDDFKIFFKLQYRNLETLFIRILRGFSLYKRFNSTT